MIDTIEMLKLVSESNRTYECFHFGWKYRFSRENGLTRESDSLWKDSEETTTFEFLNMEDWKIVDHIEQITKEEIENLIGKTIGEIISDDTGSESPIHSMNAPPNNTRKVILLIEEPGGNIDVKIGYHNAYGEWRYWNRNQYEYGWRNIDSYIEDNMDFLDVSKEENFEVNFIGWQELRNDRFDYVITKEGKGR